MESFSETVVSPLSEQARQIISSSEETSFDADKSLVDEESPPSSSLLVPCFFVVVVNSSASSYSTYLRLLSVEAIVFSVKATICRHSSLYGVISVNSNEECARLFSEET
jgi:hypothetical protein